MNNRVIVTGGSGFVGTNLVSFFSEQGWKVKNFDIAEPRDQKHLHHWKKVDLLDRSQLISETQRFHPEIFLHFGARTDLDEKRNLDAYAVNIEGVCNTIEAIRATPSIHRVIFASSQLVCRLGYTPRDDYDYQPTTLYGRSKVLGERIVRAADDIGAIWTIVRPTSLWGPWFDVPYKNFFNAIAKNMYLHPRGIRTQKQWGFIGNTVFQVWKIIQAQPEIVHKRTFYLADYIPVELHDFADKVQVCLGVSPIRAVSPKLLKIIANMGDSAQKLGCQSPPLTSFRYHNLITPEIQDITPIREIAGTLPYNLDQGIEITIDWMSKN